MEDSVDQTLAPASTAGAESPPQALTATNLVAFPDRKPQRPITFDRKELSAIFDLYGRNVASGEWRDYAMEFTKDQAVFAIFRRSSEQPLYRIVKDPALARKQGAFAVIAQGGMILKRGQELAQVLRVLIKKPKMVE